jgi:[ribosomal protein S5]-alanine N-acetyltransferase
MTIDAAFTHFPTLTTPRLRLRQIRESDAEALFTVKSDPEITARYGQEPHHSPADTIAWIRRILGGYPERDNFFWALTLAGSDVAIGSCTFWNFDFPSRSAELGYELGQAYWRQGLMSEALTALLAFGFGELELNRVEACPLAVNEPSSSLLRKLGFSYEGNLRQRHFLRGQYYDQLYFGMLREDWERVRKPA